MDPLSNKNYNPEAGSYPFDYRVVGFLPSLPSSGQSALQDCDVCYVLRGEIIRAGFNYTSLIGIALSYGLEGGHSFEN